MSCEYHKHVISGSTTIPSEQEESLGAAKLSFPLKHYIIEEISD